ncbi:uncharacterized protein B0T23DRAFT_441571 [Neurospora hispaniola]|uniref:Uncharacterized protein n=1 Tax=Neurospora hispaniola TaxID=588809 RepID=A0AAJ0MQZ6_9PEZI|nr:hypothetical protein B0T23DRAFT_441571 [Neurospora hispaniola]
MSNESERGRIRDEVVPAFGHAAQASNALKRRKKGSPYYFRGAVRIAHNINAAVSEAIDALEFVSTAQKTQLCIFADGSFDRPTYNGGYAIAYNGFSLGPNTSSDDRPVAKGWTAIRTKDNHTCEGLSIAQSLREAMKELTTLEEHVAARHIDTAATRDPVEASVKIFSDSQTVLKAIKAGKFPQKMKHTGHAIITFSEELREKFRGPGCKLKVDLVVHWIPGHHGSFPLHQNGADGVYEEVKAAKRYKEERLLRWREREWEEIPEAEEHHNLQLQQIADEEYQGGQPPQQTGPHTQQPASQQPDQQEWYNQVQTYYDQYAGYWEQLGRWQDWQRAHGHQAGQWLWDHGANQWIWQWDNHNPGETGNGQPPT